MRRAGREPVAIAATTSLCLAGVLGLGPGPLRWVLGGALVLALPGLALSGLVGSALSNADRLLAAIAVSIATAILTGLALGALHAGFSTSLWAPVLGAVVLAASLAALLCRPAPLGGERPRYTDARAALRRCAPSLVCFTAAVALVALAIALAHESAAHNAENAARIVNLVPAHGGAR